jgi:hypothetical protein
MLSSNGLGYHEETGSPWYGRIAQLIKAFGICPEGPGFNPQSGHFYKFNTDRSKLGYLVHLHDVALHIVQDRILHSRRNSTTKSG